MSKDKKCKIRTNDYLELKVIDILSSKNIRFVHESENNGSTLDFFLPDFDVYIECKQFHADRVVRQLASRDNVILIQGSKSIKFLEQLLK